MPETLGGNKYRLSTVPGYSDSDVLTSPATSTVSNPTAAPGDSAIVGVPKAGAMLPKASAVWWLVGLLAVVILFHLIHREEKEGVDPNFMGISAWNFLSTGLMASLFIITLKVGANKWFAGSTFAAVTTSI